MAPTGTASRPARKSASSGSRRVRSPRSASKPRSGASGVSGSTATATTVTAEASPPPYVGRFAPSPTGPLHLGSLIAALGSFLDARRHAGRWLLRMEDLDRERVVPGCADEMLRTLEVHGLSWDGTVEYQSTHVTRYGAALAQL